LIKAWEASIKRESSRRKIRKTLRIRKEGALRGGSQGRGPFFLSKTPSTIDLSRNFELKTRSLWEGKTKPPSAGTNFAGTPKLLPKITWEKGGIGGRKGKGEFGDKNLFYYLQIPLETQNLKTKDAINSTGVLKKKDVLKGTNGEKMSSQRKNEPETSKSYQRSLHAKGRKV